ncbi:hypothetical protein BJX99DRAFT_262791 [Aspergillus californicus]
MTRHTHHCPWAGVRMILQIAINDTNLFGAMIQGVDAIAKMITRYAVFETIYLGVRSAPTAADEQLRSSLTRLYAAVLTFLGKALHYYNQNTALRVTKGMVSFSDSHVDDLLSHVYAEEKFVNQDAHIVDADRQRALADIVQQMGKLTLNIRSTTIASPTNMSDMQVQRLMQTLWDIEQPIYWITDHLLQWKDELDFTRRSRILNWVSEVPTVHHHRAICEGRLPDTGGWLFRKLEFLLWQSASYSSVLWLHGILGSGKTMLV